MEKEFKFTASPGLESAVFEHIAALGAPAPETAYMSSVYYDTAGGALGKSGLALRLRDENGRKVMTLKGPSERVADNGFSARRERGIEVLDFEQGLKAFEKSLPAGEFKPVCGVEFVRKKAVFRVGGSLIELAFDVGRFGAGEDFCEIELELKAGEDADFAAFAEKFRKHFALTPENRSKYRRALECARRGKNGK